MDARYMQILIALNLLFISLFSFSGPLFSLFRIGNDLQVAFLQIYPVFLFLFTLATAVFLISDALKKD
jgi:hypothetical protein